MPDGQAPRAPLADRMRPRTIDQILGQSHIMGPGMLLRRMIEADKLYSVIFYGPPGTGKTSIANVIANETRSDFARINATTAGKADMKKAVENAIALRKAEGRGTILFVDEIHRFSKAQQDYLLPYVENGTVTLIGATTENPYFEVVGALLSRSRIFELRPLSEKDVETAVYRALGDDENGLGGRNVLMDYSAVRYLARIVDGDVRQALGAVELAAETTDPDPDGHVIISTDVIANCVQKRVMRFDKGGDCHYDYISAFIESMKHSETDATMYYLARMLEAGEDPKYIARRIMVCAYRDIGLANPMAIQVASAAFDAVERVGMPECADALAMAALFNATSAKSCSAASALLAARSDVKATGNIPIPAFLQDESYASAHKLGRGGVSDVFASPDHYDGSDCMPPELAGHRYYAPQPFGYEISIAEYVRWCEAFKARIRETAPGTGSPRPAGT